MEEVNLNGVMAILINNTARVFDSRGPLLEQGKNFDYITFSIYHQKPNPLDIKEGQKIQLDLFDSETQHGPIKLKCLYDIRCKVLKISKLEDSENYIVYEIHLETKPLRNYKKENKK